MNLPPRISLAHLPTPIEKLERLSRHLGGPQIYVKRDDLTGLAGGGNKLRKLEFLLAEARAQGCNHLVTLGGPQSNHVRQTAGAAARLGMQCSLVLRGDPPARVLGNLLLDEILGAHVHWSGERTREDVAEELVAALRAAGRRPYLIPVGGSTALGAIGYVNAMNELQEQLAAQALRPHAIVLASSSAGTQAGLVLGAMRFGFLGRVLGISIDASAQELSARVGELALEAAELLGATVAANELRIEVNADYLGGGYAVVGERERDAIRTVARTEGLLLDPAYTGRAMGALIDLIGAGAFDRKESILFWHTGGAPALSAFSGPLRS